MVKKIVLLSGHISSGKSKLSENLQRYGAGVVKTKDLLIRSLRNTPSRGSLQGAGEKLDRTTRGEWVAEALAEFVREKDERLVVVDSVRIKHQIDAVRRGFNVQVVHVHLTAPKDVLESRFKLRDRKDISEATFHDAMSNSTEKQVDKLKEFADICVDTSRCSENDVLIRVAAYLGLFDRDCEANVDVIIGGQYGSEGKGNIAAFLSPEYDYLIRVGGPNAGHKVYDPSFTFRHLPSGTQKNQKALIVLGPGTVINEEVLQEEISGCQLEYNRLAIDPQAMLISPRDKRDETNLKKEIGSTGQGVGFATARKIRHRSLKTKLAKDSKLLRPYIRPTYEILERAYADCSRILLEGTQGTALSIHHGHYPYVTSRDTTVAGCLAEAGIPPRRIRRILMVCRTYPIRVQSPTEGTSGPMKEPLSWEIIAKRSGISLKELLSTETSSVSKKIRRVSEFDWELLRRASSLNSPTDIALTFADYLDKHNKSARRFDQLTPDTIQFIEEIERVAAAPVSLISTRFHYRCIIDRRRW